MWSGPEKSGPVHGVDSILFRNRIVVVDPGSSIPPCADVPGVVPTRTRVPAFSRLAN